MSEPGRPGPEFVTTVGSWAGPEFAGRSVRVDVPPSLDVIPRRRFHPIDELRLLVRVLRAAPGAPLLLLYSSRGMLRVELVAAMVLALTRRRRRPRIVVYGEMFEPNRGLRFLVERLVMGLVDRSVDRFAVHTEAEIEVFSRNWDIDRAKVRSTGFFLKEAVGPPPEPSVRGDHVFAGGTSFRHWEPLLDAARLLPDRRFVLCTDDLADPPDLPANVEAGLVSPEEYNRLIATAGAVVVPLRTDVRRITGMLTYLQAMWRGVPTICSRAIGADEFIRDGTNGLLVEASAEGYRRAIEWVLDERNRPEVDRLCRQAQDDVSGRFRVEHHVERLLAVVDELLVSPPPARGQQPADRSPG